MRHNFRSKASIAWILSVMFVACGSPNDPESIAPLPSPLQPPEPDYYSIVVSSLVAENTTEEQLVAVVGIDGAVKGTGQVRLTNERKENTSLLYDTDESGAFVATLLALPGDTLRASYIDADGQESAPIKLSVREYFAPTTEVAMGANDNTSGRDSENEGTDPATDASLPPEAPATSGDDLDGDGTLETVVQLTLIYKENEARLVGAANFIGANNVLVIANQSNGAVHATTADSSGAVDHSFPANEGDIIVLFSRNPLNAELTSPAVSFVIQAGQQTVSNDS